MGFEKHLFISYAHLDNVPLTEQQQGWITRFHASLAAMLSMRLGRPAEIWRDCKLNGNDIFADEIVRQFPTTALLVSVLTPRYIASEWCEKEVREFCKSAENCGGLVIDNKARVLKVIKTPVDNEDPLPPVMKNALGYPFYIFDEQQTPIELDPAYGEEFTQKYNLKVAKLAYDVAQLIKKLETQSVVVEETAQAQTTIQPDSKPAIYLAECSYDRRDAREALEAEFRLHGYTILPDRQLPTNEKDYLEQVDALLGKCKLSIHLVGANYGVVPDGPSEKSIVVLQNELAIQHSKTAGLQRVIWLPEGTQSGSPRQQEFIETLLKDGEAQFGADLITADLDTVKGAVHAALKKLEAPEAPKIEEKNGGDGSKLIYLICNERDRKATIPLRKFLKAQGFDAQIPLFEGDAATIRQAHQDLLTQCDAVILFYGAGDEAWKRSIESDLKKMRGYRSGRPLLASYTYLAEPVTDDKKDLLDLEEPNLIRALEGFSEPEMGAFTKAMMRSKAVGGP